MRRLILLLPLALMGCDAPWSSAKLTILWDSTTKVLTAEIDLKNIGAGLLGCDSRDTCAEALGHLQKGNLGPMLEHLDLAGMPHHRDPKNTTVVLTRRGSEVNLHVAVSTKAVDKAWPFLGLEITPGGETPSLMSSTYWDVKSGQSAILSTAQEEDKRLWTVQPGTSKLIFIGEGDSHAVPLLDSHPGLSARVTADGIFKH